ncbi:hypothetical protein QTP70_003895 [Hemibagrus guttatus]|uniref:Alkylated DNA repair protein AlkB homologue 8 N-terminal domain-containing protein n=1 Tax=Hemibagrus guttatus TaxID=175788 RepID=A0AAE0QF32_9TELE|nr:hypothetical protein QTP70_003895 [Hemibagrus guttatus]
MDIEGSSAEIVKSTKFLGVYLLENFTWSLKTSSINRKAQQHLPPTILTVFYRRTIESILSSCITAWFGNCTVLDHKNLQRIVRTAEKIIGVSLLHHISCCQQLLLYFIPQMLSKCSGVKHDAT